MNNTPLTSTQLTVRLALVGLVPLLVMLLFLWGGGWLTPQRLTSDKLVNVLQQSGGEHTGFRRNHAKGICVSGEFISSGKASTLSRATLFAPGNTPVIGRFAIAGGNPAAPDYAVPVRSLALAFQLPDGEQWRTGMNAMPFFPVRGVDGFYNMQLATRPDPATGKPDPAKVKAFLEKHPEAAPFLAWAKANVPSSSWASDRFNSLNAFRMIDKTGHEQLVRWSMVPQTPYQPISAEQKQDKNFLQRDLHQRLDQAPLKWNMVITVASSQDDGSDASRA